MESAARRNIITKEKLVIQVDGYWSDVFKKDNLVGSCMVLNGLHKVAPRTFQVLNPSARLKAICFSLTHRRYFKSRAVGSFPSIGFSPSHEVSFLLPNLGVIPKGFFRGEMAASSCGFRHIKCELGPQVVNCVSGASLEVKYNNAATFSSGSLYFGIFTKSAAGDRYLRAAQCWRPAGFHDDRRDNTRLTDKKRFQPESRRIIVLQLVHDMDA